MSLGNDPVSQLKPSSAPSPEIIAEVTVSTASAIVRSKDDPYRVLVADSEKHPKPVIPGGKVPGLSCVLREVKEEVGTELLNPTYLGKAQDPDRDIRLVPAKKVSSAVVEPELPNGVAADAMVKAHYGCPDYIFVGEVDEAALTDTEELKGRRFIDIRKIGPGDLSAGHDVILLTYRRMLDEGATSFPEESLRCFSLERDTFSESRK
jgi:ADP-ribose pyrophosphatase YjhB (NUDIX family)